MAKVNRTCEQCSAAFLTKPSVVAKGAGRYCSHACSSAAKRRTEPLPLGLTAQQLKDLFSYDTETGLFTRLRDSNNQAKAGDVAGSLTREGYLSICINRRAYLVHRLAWLYVHGEWPQHCIDHRDGVKSNNRIANLRDVPHAMNVHNRHKPNRQNTSGFLGVVKQGERFWPRINIKGKIRVFPSHATAEEAHAAYVELKRKHHEGCLL
ncbi:HNH endonuclease signature motif containing protein [Variovorax sp. PAMC 28711]|uniref:HNH endonuclease signature motif containing protein n=1 Tax=Variovorax sp. PAMC 28711 TaxID=1795631 RepID=UPI0009E77E46|nr:HNH endonuclease signature motif containing protein [Variovorax sp. PAMC 28711]